LLQKLGTGFRRCDESYRNLSVIPAEAGIQVFAGPRGGSWAPAFAGATGLFADLSVIPAKAGIQGFGGARGSAWAPASAGATRVIATSPSSRRKPGSRLLVTLDEVRGHRLPPVRRELSQPLRHPGGSRDPGFWRCSRKCLGTGLRRCDGAL